MAYDYNLSTWEAEAGGQKFKIVLNCTVNLRPAWDTASKKMVREIPKINKQVLLTLLFEASENIATFFKVPSLLFHFIVSQL